MGLRNSGQPYHNKQYNMKAIQVNGAIKKFSSLPKVWTDENGTHLNIKDGQAYGFYDVVTPTYDPATQLLGDIQWDADSNTFTYPVLDKDFPQTLEEMKASKIENLKSICNRKLAETDWYVTRLNEKETAIPQDVSDARDALRTDCDTKESEINALTTKAEVAQYDLPSYGI